MTRQWSVPGYTEVREVGRGATGVVVLADHEATGRPVAIKYLADELRTRDGFLDDFRGEAEILASIDDAHVVRLWEYVQSAGGAAIVMDIVNGVTLRRILDEQGPTEPESALAVLRGSLLGLGAAHGRGLVHRDYKPENVLVTADGDSVLTDFGIAGRAGRAQVSAGTPAYMAPEQWADGLASPRGDIYAATAGFVECLSGRPPFGASDLGMLRRQHEQAPIPAHDVPEPVRGLVRRGLAKDPDERPADVDTFLAELEAAAVAGYGADWEERGRRRLAERAALLALLFPLAAGIAGGTAVASTVLGGGRLLPLLSRARTQALLGAAAALILAIGGSVVVANTAGGPGSVVEAQAGTARPELAVPGGPIPAQGAPLVPGTGSTQALGGGDGSTGTVGSSAPLLRPGGPLTDAVTSAPDGPPGGARADAARIASPGSPAPGIEDGPDNPGDPGGDPGDPGPIDPVPGGGTQEPPVPHGPEDCGPGTVFIPSGEGGPVDHCADPGVVECLPGQIPVSHGYACYTPPADDPQDTNVGQGPDPNDVCLPGDVLGGGVDGECGPPGDNPPVNPGDPTDSTPGNPDSTDPDSTSEPDQGDSGAGDSGAGDSGAGDSGAGDSGAGDSGAGDSGAGDSGAGDSGAGVSDPGSGGPTTGGEVPDDDINYGNCGCANSHPTPHPIG